jgi:hypothetical protein
MMGDPEVLTEAKIHCPEARCDRAVNNRWMAMILF